MFWKQCTVRQYHSDLSDQSALEIRVKSLGKTHSCTIFAFFKLLSNRVRFSDLRQQNVMWRLTEWSALWSAWKVHCSDAGVCVFTRWRTEQMMNLKCMFYFVILHNTSINGLHLWIRLLCRLLHCCKPLSKYAARLWSANLHLTQPILHISFKSSKHYTMQMQQW